MNFVVNCASLFSASNLASHVACWLIATIVALGTVNGTATSTTEAPIVETIRVADATASWTPLQVIPHSQATSYFAVDGSSGPYVHVADVDVEISGNAGFDVLTEDAVLMTVDWGDGTSSVFTNPAASATYGHTYAAGGYMAIFTVFDVNDNEDSSGGTVLVPHASEVSYLCAYFDYYGGGWVIMGSVTQSGGLTVEIDIDGTSEFVTAGPYGGFDHETTTALSGTTIRARVYSGTGWSDWVSFYVY